MHRLYPCLTALQVYDRIAALFDEAGEYDGKPSPISFSNILLILTLDRWFVCPGYLTASLAFVGDVR